MSTMVDIGVAMAKWVREIEYHRDKVIELENKIQVAKELMTFPADSKVNVKQEQQDNKPSLRSRVLTLLAEKQRWLMASEIAKILQAEGLETASKHVNTLIATTANKMCELKRIVRRKRGGRVQYAIPNLSNTQSRRGGNMNTDQK